MNDRPSYMFVCLHGSAKSVIASEHFRRLTAERGLDVDVRSAGTEPDAEVPSRVVQGLLGDGIDVRGFKPRAATRDALANASRVIAFGCDLTNVAPAARVDRWDDVPAVSDGYEQARDFIVNRLRSLVDDMTGASEPPNPTNLPL
jgi:arsenate reductase (thioredoxin)